MVAEHRPTSARSSLRSCALDVDDRAATAVGRPAAIGQITRRLRKAAPTTHEADQRAATPASGRPVGVRPDREEERDEQEERAAASRRRPRDQVPTRRRSRLGMWLSKRLRMTPSASPPCSSSSAASTWLSARGPLADDEHVGVGELRQVHRLARGQHRREVEQQVVEALLELVEHRRQRLAAGQRRAPGDRGLAGRRRGSGGGSTSRWMMSSSGDAVLDGVGEPGRLLDAFGVSAESGGAS